MEGFTEAEIREQGAARAQEVRARVEAMEDADTRESLTRILEAIDPVTDCVCSDLSQVRQGKEVTCAGHANLLPWIVHTAKEIIKKE